MPTLRPTRYPPRQPCPPVRLLHHEDVEPRTRRAPVVRHLEPGHHRRPRRPHPSHHRPDRRTHALTKCPKNAHNAHGSLCRGCGRPSKRSRCSTCQGKRPRPTYTHAERKRRAATVDAWRQRYGEWCPGWGEPPHPTSPRNPLTADHVIPVAVSSDEDGTLTVLCRRCNGRKAHRVMAAPPAPRHTPSEHW